MFAEALGELLDKETDLLGLVGRKPSWRFNILGIPVFILGVVARAGPGICSRTGGGRMSLIRSQHGRRCFGW